MCCNVTHHASNAAFVDPFYTPFDIELTCDEAHEVFFPPFFFRLRRDSRRSFWWGGARSGFGPARRLAPTDALCARGRCVRECVRACPRACERGRVCGPGRGCVACLRACAILLAIAIAMVATAAVVP